MTVLLTRKAVLQGVVESSYNVAAAVGPADGFLVNNPMFTAKPNVLERNFVRNDLSPMPIIIGRLLASMTFETELRGNGVQNSGLPINAPLISRLFRASGYKQTGFSGSNVKGPFIVGDAPTPVAWAGATPGYASEVITATAIPLDGDTLTVAGKVYTFKAALDAIDGHVFIGVSEATALANLTSAINLGPGAGSAYASVTTANGFVTATNPTGSTVLLTAIVSGPAGNSLTLTTTSAELTLPGGALAGGTTAGTNTDAIQYLLTVVAGGLSGVATLAVTSDTAGENSAAAPLVSGAVLHLGTKGLSLTPSWVGGLVAGQQWVLWLMPSGISLDPVSDGFESITLVMHKDGLEHTMPGAFGTFEITAQAGNFATVKWTFTGTWVEPIDDPNPTPVFETTLPSQVELARLHLGSFPAIVEKFTFNQQNDIQIRPDVSSPEGYVGTRIVSRKPEGGVDPEADLVANNDFWGQMSTALRMPFEMRVGFLPGNTIWIIAPNTQYTGLTYTDRNGILAYDAGLRFARSLGNDEISFYLQ